MEEGRTWQTEGSPPDTMKDEGVYLFQQPVKRPSVVCSGEQSVIHQPGLYQRGTPCVCVCVCGTLQQFAGACLICVTERAGRTHTHMLALSV